MRFGKRERALQMAPLAVALALACTGATTASPIAAFSVAMPATRIPGEHSGVAALMQALHAVGTKPRPAVQMPVVTRQVTNCADDNSSDSLRSVIADAGEGDTIDLSTLACSTITLTQGAIPVMLDTLSIVGPGAGKLAIDGAGANRIFVHYGSDTFSLSGLTVRNGASVVSGFRIAAGACILSGGYVTLDHSTISGCRAIGEGAYGGGVIAAGLTLYTSTLSGNVARGSHVNTLTASYGGGGFAYRGTAALYDSTVTGNRAEPDPTNTFGSYDTGGGIFSDNGGYASGTTIDDNYSSGTGGGIASHGGFFISNSTISGNTAKNKGGGGLFLRIGAAMSVSNSTIAQNTALKGGGIYIFGSPPALDLQSTIVADNAASNGGADIAALATLTVSGMNNLIIAADPAVSLPTATLRVEPLLLPLANNGGATRTHALSTGSPALDAGNNAANLANDQRHAGFPRVLGAAADIGAFEGALAPPMQAPAPTLSGWVLGLLAGILAGFGLRTLHRTDP